MGVVSLISAVRFLWTATAGYRLHPWRSPYLRWRMETYSGQAAGTVGLADFARLGWRERAQMGRFLRWLGEMDTLRRGTS